MGSQSPSSVLTEPPLPTMADSAPEIWKAAAMADHFEKIQKLPDPVPGVPNFRRVPGYKVYCCGQPTLAGIKACLEKVTGTIYPKDGKILWFNVRQEPDVYVNGEPVCARPPNKIGEYAGLGAVTADMLAKDEPEFQRVLEGRSKDNGKLKVIDISKKEKEVEVKELKTLETAINDAKADFPGLEFVRVPVCNSAAPNEVTLISFARLLWAPTSTHLSSSMTKLGSPEPPLAVSLPASSRSSRSMPPLKVLWRLFLESILTCSRWTDTPWTPRRMPFSGESLR